MPKLAQIIEAACVQTEDENAGKPVVLLQWQKDFLDQITGKRVVWLEIPRKNGKSFLLACIAIAKMLEGYQLGANPQIILAAASRDQAKILYAYIRNQILLSPQLQRYFHPFHSEIRLIGKPGNLKVIASDGNTNHGLNPSLILCDELHAWSETKGAALYEALRTSMGARDSQMFCITTAGSAHTFSHHLHLYAKSVIDGAVVDPAWYALIFGADDDEDPFDREVWKKANPSLGTTITWKYFDEYETRAKNDALALHSFRKLHLNQWAGTHDALIEAVQWKATTAPTPRWLNKAEVILGIDFGSTNDFTAYSLLFWDEDRLYTKQYYQVTQGGWDNRKNRYPAMLKQWETEGFIEVTPGRVARLEDRHRMLKRLFEQYRITSVCYDPYLAHHGAIQGFIDYYGEDVFYAVGQQRRYLSEPTKLLYKHTYDGKLKHDQNSITAWMISNAKVKEDEDGNWKLDKDKSAEKIDGVAALVNSYAFYIHRLNQVSQYNDEDILFL